VVSGPSEETRTPGARRSLPTGLEVHIRSEAQGRHVIAVVFDEPRPEPDL
jgi:hypothetical protein